MEILRQHDVVSALGLEFKILTAARTGEVIGAIWDEIDIDKANWVVPAERMKGGIEHRVPLSPASIAVLRKMEKATVSKYVFPGAKPNCPLSNMAFLQLVKRMGRTDATPHGFRSTFKDWASERTNYSNEVSEMALAHTVGDKVEAAYRRGDLFEKRQKLMDAWAGYCGTVEDASEGNVVSLKVSR